MTEGIRDGNCSTKKQWKKIDPVKIDVRDSSLSVAGISDEAVRGAAHRKR